MRNCSQGQRNRRRVQRKVFWLFHRQRKGNAPSGHPGSGPQCDNEGNYGKGRPGQQGPGHSVFTSCKQRHRSEDAGVGRWGVTAARRAAAPPHRHRAAAADIWYAKTDHNPHKWGFLFDRTKNCDKIQFRQIKFVMYT